MEDPDGVIDYDAESEAPRQAVSERFGDLHCVDWRIKETPT